MKILRLDLRAFGPFTDVSLDLAAGEEGLHLIYGPNEAGKSSSLRALRQLFYGIPDRTADAFRHPYDKLRLGAQVRHSDGSTLEFIRRKARINTLRGPDDKSVLDPRDLARLLDGVDQGLFETMFGIDHKRLVQGGKEIVQGGGHLGQVLFAAGSGVADLRAVQDGLQAEMEELFVSRGRTKKINLVLKELEDTWNTLRHCQLSSDDWSRHHQAQRTAQQQKERLARERQQKTREQNRLTRMQNALAGIARRRELLAEAEAYRDAILLPEDFGDKRREFLALLRQAEEQAQQAAQTLEQLEQQLGQLHVPEGLLEQSEQIEDLHRRLGEYQKDLKDRQVRVLQRRQLEHEAKEILRSLGRGPEPQLDEAEHLRLRADEPLRIQNLGNQHQALVANLENARKTIATIRERIARARQELDALDAPRDPAELRRLIKRVLQQGTLEGDLATARQTLEQTTRQVTLELGRLPQWTGTLEALERLPMPAPETLDRFESELKDLRHRTANLGERLRDEETALRELDGQIHQLELHQEVPTEEDLHRVRRLRDGGWLLVRRAWQEHQESAEVRAFLTQFEPARDLAEAYEQSVQRADQIADRLRREADRVARKVELIITRQKRLEQRDRLGQQMHEIRQRLEKTQQEWTALWQPLGIAPLPPQEMRAWLRKQAELVRRAQTLRDQGELVRRLEENLALQQGRLNAGLRALGEQVGPHKESPREESLAALLERSQEVVDRFDRVQRRREQLQQEVAQRELELREAETHARHAEVSLAEWQQQWSQAMKRLGLEPEAPPAAANAFLAAISELFQKLHGADGFRRRIEGIDRDAQQFAADVLAMTQRVAPDLAALDADRAVEELIPRLTGARKAHQERQALQRQRTQEADKLRRAQESLVAAKRGLDTLCQEARCASHAELVQAEQRSQRRRQLERDLQQREEQLLTLSGGATLDEFIAEAAQVDPDGLGLEIDQLSQHIRELEQSISQLDQTIGSERTVLESMNGSAAAAQAAEQAEHFLAQLHADVQHYVVLRLAAAVLKEGIERYREKNQGPVLERARRLFVDLTVGSFEDLRIDFNEKGEAVLIGVRAGATETVSVDGMSDGCCDQLYLALRLASLEAYLENHEPIPFIVDDILLNFDNDRAVAALKALAELSRRTQVIFFTHHEHLVEMATQQLEDDVLFIHRLPGRQSAGLIPSLL